MPMIGKLVRKIRHWWRSSVTGKFVSKAFADAHPDETEEQKR
jgi:hypothetical protein